MRPAKLTYLRAGKAIGSQEHIGFCDTFNWLVDSMRNLRGDGLFITVENKMGDMPTIIFSPTTDFGTGGGGSTYTPPPKPFDYERAADGLSGTIKRGYVYFGRNGQDVNAAGTTVN